MELGIHLENFVMDCSAHRKTLVDGADNQSVQHSVKEGVVQSLQCLVPLIECYVTLRCELCEVCSGSFDEGESNFARSHLLNLSNCYYAE